MKMMFKHPGPHAFHGSMFDYKIVAPHEIVDAESEGWYKTTQEARAASERVPEPAPVIPAVVAPAPVVELFAEPTNEREALAKIAEERGVKIDGRWSIARIKQELDL